MEFAELSKSACLYWPKELAEEALSVSLISPLIETQEEFLSILKISSHTPTSWVDAIKLCDAISPNLFLKHLMVLSDVGGERLQRYSKDIKRIFPDGKMVFETNGKEHSYEFKSKRSWNTKNLNVEKSLLLKNIDDFSDEMMDVCMLILWAANTINNTALPKEMIDNCIIGNMIGNKEEITKFVRERYIMVSRQTGGSTANDLGHICEKYIKEKLEEKVHSYISLDGHTIEGITHNDKDLTTFDLVAKNTKTKKSIGIEVSFQVTTNSTIERKAGLAKSRKDLLNSAGHKVAYVIDGSGNFQRANAIRSIISHSDMTVNFSDNGINELAGFICETLK
ncbi:hypothetical protein HV346_02750 [Enterobacter sp. RHBSTW-00994]|uniref:hypothetical protein n=1 Tax=Enterobacter sp. RHBSTW-00994 TaxID=2742676 RepID=UPI0015E8FB06|nr:hypothetical protein [Enterobacter sp. RHBSTW-00994]QLR41658.1 hypothetical protein HV346_02750 [Enterobacter sp. RHBSTW-00994]